jgi:PKD repeat protein
VFTLTSDNPEISFLSDTYQADIGPDGSIIIEDVFTLVISESAEFNLSTITLNVESTLPLISGETFPLKVAVEPTGVLVYDTKQIDRDMSGLFMQQFFKQLDLKVTHTCDLPALLYGFDAVFISLENTGFNYDQCNIDGWHPDKMLKYLLDGGNLYVESAGFFGGLYYIYPTYYASLRSYFGIGSLTTQYVLNPINGLMGIPGSMMEGIAFTKSHQLYNYIFDVFTPSSLGICPFSESGLGSISVCRQGPNHNAFYLGYSLSELEDVDKTSSRYNVLLKIVDFFELPIPENYLVANFKGENRVGGSPLEVTFSDLSLTDENVDIVSREWDFDGDGTIDSNEENPVFVYNDPGHYDVMLIVSSESDSDTLVMEDYVHINQGVLVYEMREGQRNFSGTFIYDFLVDNGIEATYTSSYPQSFLGYDAVFISQGVSSYLNSTTPDRLTPMLIEYLSSGGQVYLEGADALGRDLYLVPGCLSWFGLNSASDGFYNPLENLTGTTGSIAEGLVFELSNQTVYSNQDTYSPNTGAMVALKENNIYPVAVQHDGGTHKTFCFSYALAELVDNENGTREQLLTNILNFFGFVISGEVEYDNLSSDLRIYPNPVGEKLHIQLDQQWKGMGYVALYNISGMTILKKSVSGNGQGVFDTELDTSELPPGIYFLEVKTDLENYTAKIIKN